MKWCRSPYKYKGENEEEKSPGHGKFSLKFLLESKSALLGHLQRPNKLKPIQFPRNFCLCLKFCKSENCSEQKRSCVSDQHSPSVFVKCVCVSTVFSKCVPLCVSQLLLWRRSNANHSISWTSILLQPPPRPPIADELNYIYFLETSFLFLFCSSSSVPSPASPWANFFLNSNVRF